MGWYGRANHAQPTTPTAAHTPKTQSDDGQHPPAGEDRGTPRAADGLCRDVLRIYVSPDLPKEAIGRRAPTRIEGGRGLHGGRASNKITLRTEFS